MKKSLSDRDRKIDLTVAGCSGMICRSYVPSTDNIKDSVTNMLASLSLTIMCLVLLMNRDFKHLIQDFGFHYLGRL